MTKNANNNHRGFRDSRVEAIIHTLPDWQQTLALRVRDLVLAADPEHIINQGEGNLTARAIQLYEGDRLNEQAFTKLIEAVIANNRAGGWRNLKS
jgi:hypothetical protein